MIKDLLRGLLPEPVLASIRAERARLRRARNRPAHTFSEDEFRAILHDALCLRTGDVVFVHSSMDRLGLAFPFYRVLSLLREAIGDGGTLLFPTYPRLPAHEYLLSGETFNVATSPSYTGVLTEFARRQPHALRSLSPSKSVCALGPHAEALTASHQDSPYPYDRCSPYRRITDFHGKIIGLGVSTRNMSFVHCVDDELKQDFPVRPYFDELFETRCINYAGQVEVVHSYAHDPRKMTQNIPKFLEAHVAGGAGAYGDLQIRGMPFFRADAEPLFDLMVGLARRGLTIYAALR